MSAPVPCTLPPHADEVLTSAEREVALLLLEGATHAEIAEARGCSPRTIANQVASLYRKLSVGSRVELAALTARTARLPPRADPADASPGETAG